MMAVLFVLPGIAQALPDSWRNPVTEFWPTQAGGQLTSVHHAAHSLQPWPGFGVMCLFVAIVYAIAWTLLDRCRSGAVGSKPAFTLSGLPEARERSSFERSSDSLTISAAPFLRYASCSSTGGKLAMS